jgi:hypothetical protein
MLSGHVLSRQKYHCGAILGEEEIKKDEAIQQSELTKYHDLY